MVLVHLRQVARKLRRAIIDYFEQRVFVFRQVQTKIKNQDIFGNKTIGSEIYHQIHADGKLKRTDTIDCF